MSGRELMMIGTEEVGTWSVRQILPAQADEFSVKVGDISILPSAISFR